jgi:CheY-like chemotaxis protein
MPRTGCEGSLQRGATPSIVGTPMNSAAKLRGRSSLRDEKVLVVEDDDATRESLERFFEDHGYEVISAKNGSEALALLGAGERPALILLDLMLPVMDGWQFRKAQLADPRYSGIPVVVVTAGYTAPYNVNEVILKPLSDAKLSRALKYLSPP